jgi:uncharacterized protein YggT (Ycf19 family)
MRWMIEEPTASHHGHESMEPSNPFWTYWYFHIPNYVLAALIYTLLGRLTLALFVPPDWPNYIWQAFLRLTNPILAAVATITPRMVGPVMLILAAIFWLFALRIVLLAVLVAAGLIPIVGQA